MDELSDGCQQQGELRNDVCEEMVEGVKEKCGEWSKDITAILARPAPLYDARYHPLHADTHQRTPSHPLPLTPISVTHTSPP